MVLKNSAALLLKRLQMPASLMVNVGLESIVGNRKVLASFEGSRSGRFGENCRLPFFVVVE
jgi:hypothetical protein